MIEKKTYQEVIQMLQEHQYTAPQAWEEIEEELDFAQNFSKLPTHKVEKDLWAGIEEALVEKPLAKQSKLSVYHLVLRYAAVGLFLLGLTFLLLPTQPEDTFAYRSEVEYSTDNSLAVETDDPSFDDGKDFIEENSFLYAENKFEEYQTQLKNLEVAIADITQMQEQYGTDADGLKLLARMERQKATLIKSMINTP